MRTEFGSKAKLQCFKAKAEAKHLKLSDVVRMNTRRRKIARGEAEANGRTSVEYCFLLTDYLNGNQGTKRKMMTISKANKLNWLLRGSGFGWNRVDPSSTGHKQPKCHVPEA